MDEERQAGLDRELHLATEHVLLGVARRVVPVVVEAAFADRDDVRRTGKPFEFSVPARRDFGRVVRMDAGGGEESRFGLGQREGTFACHDARAGDDDRVDTRRLRALQHGLAVVRERAVRQIRADVDHGMCRS